MKVSPWFCFFNDTNEFAFMCVSNGIRDKCSIDFSDTKLAAVSIMYPHARPNRSSVALWVKKELGLNEEEVRAS